MKIIKNKGWYFFFVVVLIYIITYIIKPSIIKPALNYFLSTIIKILPVFLYVFVIMFIINYYITPKKLAKKMHNKRAWLIAIITGILSTGPVYIWYPILAELKKHKLKQGLIATFIYCRAVKPALIPIIIFYFGLTFTIVLSIVIIIFSVIQGIIIEKII